MLTIPGLADPLIATGNTWERWHKGVRKEVKEAGARSRNPQDELNWQDDWDMSNWDEFSEYSEWWYQ
jgi:hypothetical protein